MWTVAIGEPRSKYSTNVFTSLSDTSTEKCLTTFSDSNLTKLGGSGLTEMGLEKSYTIKTWTFQMQDWKQAQILTYECKNDMNIKNKIKEKPAEVTYM